MSPIVASGGDALAARRAENPAGFWLWSTFNMILFVVVPLVAAVIT